MRPISEIGASIKESHNFLREIFTLINNLFEILLHFISVLCELFDKADTSGDGKVSLEEFVTMCDQYGVKLMEEEVEEFTTLSNKSGEVNSL